MTPMIWKFRAWVEVVVTAARGLHLPVYRCAQRGHRLLRLVVAWLVSRW
jgi:hypothetical protein